MSYPPITPARVVTEPSGRKTGYTMLYNGDCPGPSAPPVGFIHTSSGFDNHMALNNRGEIFVWGASSYEYTGQAPVPSGAGFNPSIYHTDPSGSCYLDFLVKVGTKSDWVTCDHIDNFYLALDSEGYMWAWGDSYLGSCGWTDTSKYDKQVSGSNPAYLPGGSIALTPTRLEGHQWIALASGQYHTLLQRADKSLWALGLNDNGSFGTTTVYPDGYKAYTPVQMTWLPGPVKLFAANTDVNVVVLENNEVWAWGDYSWTGGSPLTPIQLPLTIPTGVSITSVKCEYNAVIVLLSNGEVYTKGSDVGLVGPPDYESMVFTKLPGDRTYVAIDVFDTSAGALDSDGNLWGWGPGRLFISRDDDFCDESSYTEPVLICSPSLNARKWKAFSIGLRGHIAILNDGRLFAWGSDIFGQLGVGSIPGSFTCSVLECGPIIYEDGTPVGTSSGIITTRLKHVDNIAGHKTRTKEKLVHA